MRMEIGVNLGILLLFAGFALFSEPISVAHAGKPSNSPVTCTLNAGYIIDTSSGSDVLTPFAFPADDCAIAGCYFVLSGRLGDVGDYWAVCQGSTPCDAFTTVSVGIDVASYPYTDEPEIFAFCSNVPSTDASCFTSGTSKGCNIKEVDCFAGLDQSCSASKKLGGGIKGTFVCLLDLPEPPATATPGIATVTMTARCELS